MRVDLAAQVNCEISLRVCISNVNLQALSFSVSKGLSHKLGPIASETSRFVDMFDKFFDALNVVNFDSSRHERKPFKDSYRSASDFRIKVCNKSKLYNYIGYSYYHLLYSGWKKTLWLT